MKLSVIIPVYNSQAYLEKCLNSVVNQKYSNLEIIIINDGSTDNSENIIKKFQKKYSQLIKYYKQENKGQAVARNVGLAHMTGDFVTFVDSDDYLDLSMYQKMMSQILETKSDMVICDMYLEKNQEKTLLKTTDFDSLFNCTVSLCNKIFCQKLIANQKFIEKIWYEDYNFFINLCLKNPNYSLVKEPLYIYRVHENSTMNNDNALKNLDIIKATDDILAKNISINNAQTLIVNHILIDAINRVNAQTNSNKKTIIKELNNYVHKNIKNIFKTQIYQNSSFKRKIIIFLNYYHCQWLSKKLLNLKRSK